MRIKLFEFLNLILLSYKYMVDIREDQKKFIVYGEGWVSYLCNTIDMTHSVIVTYKFVTTKFST